VGSLFEQQLMEGGAAELPMGTLQRLNSVHDINEQLLRESSDFADFRVEYYPARHGLSVSQPDQENKRIKVVLTDDCTAVQYSTGPLQSCSYKYKITPVI
jgi:hypothetical protein